MISNDWAAILNVSKILNAKVFKSAACEVFSTCKALLGATSGYIALLSEDGMENKALYLDPGGFPCRVDSSLPMPVRGLRQKVYETGKAVYENSFDSSEWIELIPPGHSFLKNVLFVPMLMDGFTIGLLGLANKEGGFSDFDADVATSFGRLAAVTLKNISITEKLRAEQERFHSVVETASDAVICIDTLGKIVYWNHASQQIFGYTYDEVIGKPVSLIIPAKVHGEHQKALERLAESKKSKFPGKTIEADGTRKDGSSFPLEVSVAKWSNNNEYYFTGILRDITERKLMEKELFQANQRLIKANKELIELSNHKSEFLANMSHELRTPLTAILALTGEILKQRHGPLNKKQQEQMIIVRNSAEKQLILIHELLEFSKIESGRVALNLSEVSVGKITQEVIRSLKPLADEKVIKINAEIQDKIKIIADSCKVRQVVTNLLGNAIKFSLFEGEIKVEVMEQFNPVEGIVLKVTDSGPGVPPEEQGSIFEAFYQVDRGLNKKHQGTGLGLALVKKIMDLHLGTVSVENLDHGKGAVFTVVWPAYPCYQHDLD